MGFEKTIAEYRDAKQQLAEAPAQELELIRANALQKAWADRMCEELAVESEDQREDITVDTALELGDWFRKQVLEFPASTDKLSRKQYYMDLFDEDPERAVRELQALYRSTLH